MERVRKEHLLDGGEGAGVSVREGRELWEMAVGFVWQDKDSKVPHLISSIFFSNYRDFPQGAHTLLAARYRTLRIGLRNAVKPFPHIVYLKRLDRVRAPLCAAFAAAVITLTLLALSTVFGLRLSLTDSAAPAGIYRVGFGLRMVREALVEACLPIAVEREGLARGYLASGDCPGGAEPVAKLVGALPGDVIDVDRSSVAVNGTTVSTSLVADQDTKGRQLPHVPWGRHVALAGQVWLFGFNNARSWDSRYFGPVPLGGVRGILEPVFTW